MANVGLANIPGDFGIWNVEPGVGERTDRRPIYSPLFIVPTHDFDPAHFDVAHDSHPDCNQVDPDSLGHKRGQTSGCFSGSSRSLRPDPDGVDAVSCSIGC